MSQFPFDFQFDFDFILQLPMRLSFQVDFPVLLPPIGGFQNVAISVRFSVRFRFPVLLSPIVGFQNKPVRFPVRFSVRFSSSLTSHSWLPKCRNFSSIFSSISIFQFSLFPDAHWMGGGWVEPDLRLVKENHIGAAPHRLVSSLFSLLSSLFCLHPWYL